jgi:hypothetical protein
MELTIAKAIEPRKALQKPCLRGCLKSLTGCKKALSVYAVNRK